MHSFKWILKVEVRHVTTFHTRIIHGKTETQDQTADYCCEVSRTTPLRARRISADAHVADNYRRTDWKISTGGAKSSQSASKLCVFLGTCVCVCVCERSREERKDSGQQGQTRQPLRSHQVCRDTLEHSEPDGICPPGVRSRPDDIQTQGQAEKGRKNRGWHILPGTRNMFQ